MPGLSIARCFTAPPTGEYAGLLPKRLRRAAYEYPTTFPANLDALSQLSYNPKHGRATNHS